MQRRNFIASLSGLAAAFTAGGATAAVAAINDKPADPVGPLAGALPTTPGESAQPTAVPAIARHPFETLTDPLVAVATEIIQAGDAAAQFAALAKYTGISVCVMSPADWYAYRRIAMLRAMMSMSHPSPPLARAFSDVPGGFAEQPDDVRRRLLLDVLAGLAVRRLTAGKLYTPPDTLVFADADPLLPYGMPTKPIHRHLYVCADTMAIDMAIQRASTETVFVTPDGSRRTGAVEPRPATAPGLSDYIRLDYPPVVSNADPRVFSQPDTDAFRDRVAKMLASRNPGPSRWSCADTVPQVAAAAASNS